VGDLSPEDLHDINITGGSRREAGGEGSAPKAPGPGQVAAP